jgi:hypothetical protein
MNPYREVTSCAATQALPTNSWNAKIDYRFRKRHPLVPIWARPILSLTIDTLAPRSSLCYTSTSILAFLVASYLPASAPITITYSSFIRATWPGFLMLVNLIIQIILENSISDEASHYAAFSDLLSRHSSSVQIFSSALCSQTSPAQVPPLISETIFYIRKQPQAKV